METLLAVTVGGLVAGSVYLFLARDLMRMLLGFVLLGTGANLLILTAGRVGSMVPPLVDAGAGVMAADAANPLPQALILTAIVIGFGLAAFTLVLVMKAVHAFGSARSSDMSEAEGIDAPAPASLPAVTADHRREAA